jgi:hypothetical protein
MSSIIVSSHERAVVYKISERKKWFVLKGGAYEAWQNFTTRT